MINPNLQLFRVLEDGLQTRISIIEFGNFDLFYTAMRDEDSDIYFKTIDEAKSKVKEILEEYSEELAKAYKYLENATETNIIIIKAD